MTAVFTRSQMQCEPNMRKSSHHWHCTNQIIINIDAVVVVVGGFDQPKDRLNTLGIIGLTRVHI